MTDWSENYVLIDTNNDKGRSITGHATESLVVGRALLCGYNLFISAFPSAKYDAVLDSHGNLYRIEIKGSSTRSISLTSGGRSGQQIDRNVESRTSIVSKDDADFIVGINKFNGDCYIIPTEVVNILNRKSLSFGALEVFKEKWKIFLRETIDPKILKSGLLSMSEDELLNFDNSFSFDTSLTVDDYQWPRTRKGYKEGFSEKDILVLELWKHVFLSA